MGKDRSLGRTGLEVTRMGLGLAALGRPGYITLGRQEDLPADRSVDALQAQANAVLDAAYDAGVRVFDVARSYGRAEAFLRQWLDRRDLDPGDVVVSSKWGYTYTADWRIEADTHEVKEHSVARLRQQWALTRQQLWEYLDVYQVHSASLDSGVLDNDEVLDAMAGLKAAHGIKIGLSLTGPKQAHTLDKAVAVHRDGHRLFDTVQATWNPLEPSVGAALLEAREAGLGVIIKESLANGRLTERGRSTLSDGAALAIDRAVARHRTTVDAWAIAAALAQPWVDVVLMGAVTEAQVASNLSAQNIEWTDDDSAALSELAEDAEWYWSYRKQLPWR